MEGDLESNQGKNAGIIPRTLYKLFDKLEKEDSEYSVHVSCLEIYNEELRDLLANDDAASQPKLKIFEDLNRRGSNEVQGMEKILVNSAKDVITILQKSSVKRQTAATKMNEFSSRSHCIFTITVHIKETTSDGEDLLKVGKLNLVDLAGSENVGRSGAEKGRAKEAGMINQSLLTLGRVINSLVEKGLHIPYRESKLTRLLQDSLGGKTKTCIIAAVSPAKANLEESLSTLDYAHRAKNIRNKPEVNQRMTKKALIRDFETQIERLKLDLQATREKNGVYMAAETYKDLMETTQGRKDRIDEMEKTVLAKEEAIAKLESEFASQMLLLEKTRHELFGTQKELATTTSNLNEALESVSTLGKHLTEQKVLTQAHFSTEQSLHSLQPTLFSFMHGAVCDNQSLHDKIDRKNASEISNLRLFNEFQSGFLRDISDIESGLESLKTCGSLFVVSVSEKLQQLRQTQFDMSRNAQLEATEFMKLIASSLSTVNDANRKSQTESTNFLKTLRNDLVKFYDNHSKQLMLNDEFQRKSLDSINATLLDHAGFSQLSNQTAELSTKIKEIITAQLTIFQQTRDSALNHMAEEIQLLRSHNKLLQNQLSANEAAQSASQVELLSSITELVKKFTDDANARTLSVHSAAEGHSQTVLELNERRIAGVEREYLMSEEAVRSGGESVLDLVNKLGVDSESRCNQSKSKLSDANGFLSESLLRCSGSREALSKSFEEAKTSLLSSCEKLSDHSLASVMTLADRIDSSNNTCEMESSKIVSNILKNGHEADQCLLTVETLVNSFNDGYSSITSDISHTVSHTRNEVHGKRFNRDQPTGETPRKRKMQCVVLFWLLKKVINHFCRIPTDWYKTRDHEDILQKFRESGDTNDLSEQIELAVPSLKKPLFDRTNSGGSGLSFSDGCSSRMDSCSSGSEDERAHNSENIGNPFAAPPADKVSASMGEKDSATAAPVGRMMGKIRSGAGGSSGVLSKLPTSHRSRGSS
ncbi:kinesin motor protein cin8 [Entophlyctis luteolus]|nr:kinesin motor protein cin8 [Entophlyctis luteolus]